MVTVRDVPLPDGRVVRTHAPVLLVQGGRDRVAPPAHADLLARALPSAERWSRADDGHISVLDACPDAMDCLAAAWRTDGRDPLIMP
ncbi:MAG TPA: alpha/beta hydrolase [Pseudonocardia sp.]|nr:alpha/beta hydrolase [Pseudonocardia sp.]